MKQHSNGGKQSIEAGQFLADLTASGGTTARGELGSLRVALEPGAMRVPPGTPSPVAWLLPLADIEMVRLSANIPGQLLWLSPRPPYSLAGALVGDFQGAWWNGIEACVTLGGEVESYLLPSGSTSIGSIETLALIVALRWTGESPSQVRAAIRSSSAPQFVPSALFRFSHPQPALA